MSETITVQKREQTGSLRMKRLRQTGQIPGVLYGLGQDNIMLSVDAKQLNKAVHSGNRVVQLAGAASEEAFIKDVQWDAFGVDVLHVDFTRIDKDATADVSMAFTVKGDAPGAGEGGEVTIAVREIEFTCAAHLVPDELTVSIAGLGLDGTITAGDFKLPAGATLKTPAETVVISCAKPVVVTEDSEG